MPLSTSVLHCHLIASTSVKSGHHAVKTTLSTRRMLMRKVWVPTREASTRGLDCESAEVALPTLLSVRLSTSDSGKKKAHKHKSFWPVTPPVTGRSPDREARGQSFMCCPRNPRNIKSFRPDTRPGGPVTGATGKVLCEKVLCAFSAP